MKTCAISMIFALGALVLSAFFVQLTILLCNKYKKFDPIVARSMHNGNIPRLGGIGIFHAFSIVITTYKIIFKDYSFSTIPVLAGGVIIWIIGIFDDLTNLHAKYKFLLQLIVIGFVCALSPYYIERFYCIEFPVVVGRIITFCWVIVLVNAFNLIDGIDLLCSTLVLISIVAIAFVSGTIGKLNMTAIILAASIAGFMFFNKPDAKIFLGDCGSQTLGYCVAVMPLITEHPVVKENQMLLMYVLAAIPVEDVIAAVWRRKRDHRSIFSSDRAHIHHKLVNIGFTKVQTLFYISLIHIINCGMIVLSGFMGKYSRVVVLLSAVVITQVFFISIHFINRAVNRKFNGYLPANPQEVH